MGNLNNAQQDHFPATRWSLVLAAQTGEPAAAHKAIGELCRTYWYPLYAYARRRGLTPQDAEDRTQEFFASLIERDSIASVQAERGKLRSFLLSGMKNAIASNQRRECATKRGGDTLTFSMDQDWAESRLSKELSSSQSPDVVFDRNWAQAILEAASQRLGEWYQKAERASLYDQISPFLDGRDNAESYAKCATVLGIPEATLRSALFQMRKRYRSFIEAEISETVTSKEEAAAEMQHLRSVLAGR